MVNGHLWLKTLHLLGVVLFLGNIIVTGWWKVMANRTGDARIIASAQRQVTLTDYVFTGGGVVLVLVGGFGAAAQAGLDWTQVRWLVWGVALFSASGVLWVAILIPVQIAQAPMARTFEAGGPIPRRYHRLERIWLSVGTLPTLLPLANLYWMVFKPL